MTNIIDKINAEQLNKDLPEFSPGDTIVVNVKVKEGNRERLQAFEGVCIAIRNRGLNSAFTVRKISHGTGVERVFQTHSPLIDSIRVKRRGDVRRAARLFEAAVASNPEAAHHHLNLAMAYEALGHSERARRHYQTFVDLAPPELAARAAEVRRHLSER